MTHVRIWTIILGLVLILGLIMILTKKHQQPIANPGTVVILNGPSSVGKSSIIKAFQALSNEPWLAIGIDNFFVGILPPKFYLEDTPEHRTVMHGMPSTDAEGNKVFTLIVGQAGQKVIKGMHRAIAAYAKEGNNVIVDYINYEPAWGRDLKNVLAGIKTIWVGIHASLESIEEREKLRGTSPQGHARSHYATVHQGLVYDINIDTDLLKPEESAQLILNKVKNI